MLFKQESGITYVTVEGCAGIAHLPAVPSLASILRETEAWGDIYSAIDEAGDPDGEAEIMVENAIDNFKASATKVIRQLSLAGVSADEMFFSDMLPLRADFIEETLQQLEEALTPRESGDE